MGPQAVPKSQRPTKQPRRSLPTTPNSKSSDFQRKEMFTAFINDALTRHCSGDSEPFNQLVSEFNPNQGSLSTSQKPESSSQRESRLRLWLTALSHVVSRLERVHSPLIQAVAELSWATMESPTVKAYTIFMGMLLSAHPEYLSLVLGKIAHGFTYQHLSDSISSNLQSESPPAITRRIIYDRQHYLLQHLLSLIPTLSATLLPLLAKSFPHKRQKEASHTIYIRNLLRVGSYCPEIADKLLGIIVDRAVRIDVEIQVEIDDLEDSDIIPSKTEDMFDFDLFDTIEDVSDSSEDGDSDGGNFSDISSDAGVDDIDTLDGQPSRIDLPMNVRHIKEMVNKLDAILLLVFEHSDRIHQQAFSLQSQPEENVELPSLPPLPPITLSSLSLPFDIPDPPAPSQTIDEAPALNSISPNQLETTDGLLPYHHTLLSLFERLLLPTFKSRYTQFLLFHGASLSPAFADLFLGLLLERALYLHNVPAVTRAAAASYISSFVSRARFISRATTRSVVAVFCEYMINSISTLENETGSIGGQDTPTFYAVVQAVFLIFCFRWRDLLDDDLAADGDTMIREKKRWMKDLHIMHRVINSVLNPLQVCSPNVTYQFAKVAQATDFVYCYTILEANTRASTSEEQERPSRLPLTHSFLDITSELNTFFPFDPYKLPRSSKYVDQAYREWGEVAIEVEEGEDEEEEDSDDSGEDQPMNLVSLPIPRRAGTSLEDDDMGLGKSLGAMSISPDRPRIPISS